MFSINIPNKKYAFVFLKIITGICIFNSILLFLFDSKNYILYTMIFPIGCLFATSILLFFLFIFNLRKYNRDELSLYIKSKKPKIWKSLHPLGDYSHSGSAYIKFIMGKFDNGRDEKLNNFKKNERDNFLLFLWAMMIAPVFWGLNIIIIFLCRFFR